MFCQSHEYLSAIFRYCFYDFELTYFHDFVSVLSILPYLCVCLSTFLSANLDCYNKDSCKGIQLPLPGHGTILNLIVCLCGRISIWY